MTIEIGQVYWAELDKMVHGKRPVCVMAIKDGKVWLMPLTTRLDCKRAWDVIIEPNATNGVARLSKTSPNMTQAKPISFLSDLTPKGRIDAAKHKEMMAGYRLWKTSTNDKTLVLKK